MKELIFIIFLAVGVTSCMTSNNQNNSDKNDGKTVVQVDASHFTSANANTKITTVSCTLSDGTKTNW